MGFLMVCDFPFSICPLNIIELCVFSSCTFHLGHRPQRRSLLFRNAFFKSIQSNLT